MPNPIIAWTKKYQVKVLVFLLVITVGVGFYYLRQSPYEPKPLNSSANDVIEAHWPHGKLPFNLTYVNNTSKAWRANMNFVVGNWNKANVMTLTEKKGTDQNNCWYFIPEALNFCGINDKNEGVTYATFVYWNDTGHIVAGALLVNDAYLFNSSFVWGNEKDRNKILCYMSGFVIGARWREGDNPKSTSCMEPYWLEERMAQQQTPDAQDLTALKQISDHNDDVGSSAVAYKVVDANKALAKKNFGQLKATLNSGSQNIYELDLGNGYIMKTIVQNP